MTKAISGDTSPPAQESVSAWEILRRSWPENLRSFRFRFKRLWNQLLCGVPLPVRLPYGGWWLARNDVCDDAVFVGNFEEGERRFLEKFLCEGMTVLDVGAHHGFYTMLEARKVGGQGRVLAFEPSPREHARLLYHLRLNQLCSNISVHPLALGREEGEATFFVVEGRDTGCNSLCPPLASEPTSVVRVRKTYLDRFLDEQNIAQVDFIKMDVEGGELDVLEGAVGLLSRHPRPVILAEVDDGRTSPWGYPGSAIYDFLTERDYQWFSVDRQGALHPFPRAERYASNLVAFPDERLQQAEGLMSAASHRFNTAE